MGSVSAREAKRLDHYNYVQTSTVANKIELNISIEAFFNLLWKDKDSAFYKEFLTTSLKCFDVSLETWWLQESTYTINRNIHTKHKNNSKMNATTAVIDTIKQQTITYNPSDMELTINETVSFKNAPYSDKFKLVIVWRVNEVKSELIKNVSTSRSYITITARIEFHESLKGKKLRAKIATEIFEELQIEYYLYYQSALQLVNSLQNNKETFVLEKIKALGDRAIGSGSVQINTMSPAKFSPSRSSSPTRPHTPASTSSVPAANYSDDVNDDVSSLSSISVPPVVDSSDEEDNLSNKQHQHHSSKGGTRNRFWGGGGVVNHGSKPSSSGSQKNSNNYGSGSSSRSVDGSSIHSFTQKDFDYSLLFLQLSLTLHYAVVSYFAVNMTLQTPITPIQVYDKGALLIVLLCAAYIVLRVYVTKITYAKVFANFRKVNFVCYALALYVVCILLNSAVRLSFHSILLSAVAFYLFPLCITTFTTILKHNTATKAHGGFLNFVRMYLFIAYALLVQLPLIAFVYIPMFIDNNLEARLLYVGILNHIALVLGLYEEAASLSILVRSFGIIVLSFVAHLVFLWLH